jgi:hypothetical protein
VALEGEKIHPTRLKSLAFAKGRLFLFLFLAFLLGFGNLLDLWM